MVNRGSRIVNCRPRVTKHARRKIIFFYGDALALSHPFSLARSRPRRTRERIESEVVYADYIVPPAYLSPVLPATYTEPAPRVHTLCTFVTVSFLPRLERALISSSSKESACTSACRPCARSLSLSPSYSLFPAGWISMPSEKRRCANVKGDEKGEEERGRKREREECLKSRLMIRDDMRHSSLSDVCLDCRYCSLSFIFRELATHTDVRMYMRECMQNKKQGALLMIDPSRGGSRRAKIFTVGVSVN